MLINWTFFPFFVGVYLGRLLQLFSGYTDLVTEDDFEVDDVVTEKSFQLNVIELLIDVTRDVNERRRNIRSLGNYS